MIRRIAIALCGLLLTGASLHAQSFSKARMDSLFDALAANDRLMGSFAVAKNGRIVYARAIGAAQLDGKAKVPATTATEYRIGSISKMFTATLIFQLIESGRLSLGTPLGNYFPQVPGAQQITIGHLLSHRSGIHNFTDDSTYQTWYRKPQTKGDMLKVIAGSQPDFPPDSTASYSNANYVLLGYIVEAIYKKPYSAVLQQQITGPHALTHTRFMDKGKGRNETLSYRFEGKWTGEPVTDMSVPGGAGAVLSTPSDLIRFVNLLFEGKILHRESVEQMRTIRDGYGYGLFTFPFGKKKFYGHTGGIDAFMSVVGYNPEDSVSVAYCINGARYSANQAAIGLLSIYYNKPFAIPEFHDFNVAPEALAAYTGDYSSKDVPLVMQITMNGNMLKAQATGQRAFPLEPSGKHQFRFDGAGVVMDFDPAAGTMVLRQGGKTYAFTREQKQ